MTIEWSRRSRPVRSLVILPVALITAFPYPLQAQSLDLDSESFFYGLGEGADLFRSPRDGETTRYCAKGLVQQVLQRMAADRETPHEGKANIAQGLNDVNKELAACQLRLDP